MYVKRHAIVKGGKRYVYLRLVEAYRDERGRVRHRVLRTLGREDELGSLEPGKLADIALWRMDDLGHADVTDPVAALVFGPPPVLELLLVGGKPVVRGGALLTASVMEIAAHASKAHRQMLEIGEMAR